MNELMKVFNYHNREVRTIIHNGDPWFVAKDVCDILEHSNSRKAIKDHCDSEDVTKSYIGVDTGLGQQNVEVNLVNESGVYSLVFGSTLPEARKFKRWITHEVIPSIRKHGMYATPDTVEKMLQDPDTMIKTLQALKEERAAKDSYCTVTKESIFKKAIKNCPHWFKLDLPY